MKLSFCWSSDDAIAGTMAESITLSFINRPRLNITIKEYCFMLHRKIYQLCCEGKEVWIFLR
ncbi:MAG: DUF6679 family protein, partial [Cyanobacteria bacterium P01_H01_bin.153]